MPITVPVVQATVTLLRELTRGRRGLSSGVYRPHIAMGPSSAKVWICFRLTRGEATPWHRDPFHRVTVVLSGDLLRIEFRDGGNPQECTVSMGEVDWSEPSERIRRAVNVGKEVFEEVVTFLLDRSDAVPQPEAD